MGEQGQFANSDTNMSHSFILPHWYQPVLSIFINKSPEELVNMSQLQDIITCDSSHLKGVVVY